MQAIKKINLFMLTLLITGAIDSIRNLPATALFGSSLIFFCLFAAVIFLIPTALVSAELSAKFPKTGGMFHWAKLAFGDHVAFLSVWLQWINTMVWYPTLLAFMAGTLSYLINPALMQNKIYLVSVILVIFWVQTLINLKGIHLSAKFSSLCAVVGMVIPMVLIILLGIIWLVLAKPMHIQFSGKALMPTLFHPQNWLSLTAIMASYLGMELAAVHVNDVKNPQFNFPRALAMSVGIILGTVIFASLSIAMVVPVAKISLVGGVFQGFGFFLKAYHLSYFLPVLVVMVLIGSMGSLTSWVISPAKGLLQSAELGFLPKWLSHTNKHAVAGRLLMIQAILVSILASAFLFLPSVNGSYWLLTDMSTQLYMLMYIILFLSAIAIKFKYKIMHAAFTIKGGKFGLVLVSLFGLLGCVVSVVAGFIPPTSIDVGSASHFDLTLAGGMIIMVLPVCLFFGFRLKRRVS